MENSIGETLESAERALHEGVSKKNPQSNLQLMKFCAACASSANSRVLLSVGRIFERGESEYLGSIQGSKSPGYKKYY